MTIDQRPGDSPDGPAYSDNVASNARNSTDPESGRREPVFTEFGEEEDYEESGSDTVYASAYEDEPEAEEYVGSATLEEDWHEDEEDYPEDQDDYRDHEEEYPQTWPLGPIAVALVAILLLGAGGYGVIQQRTAMQEEIRQLQGSLATAANPEELSAGRAALREQELRNSDQLASLDAVKAENRRLQDRINRLERQLQAAASSSTSAPTAKPTNTTASRSTAAAQAGASETPAAKPASAAPAAANSGAADAASTAGDWFVNFGSYSQNAVAQSWAKKIKPATGKVAVSPGSKDGKTFYRVRVVALADRAEAENVSRQLQRDYDLPKLWVGSSK